MGYAVDLASHELFRHSRARQSHGLGVHSVADRAGVLNLGYLERGLYRTHLHHCFYEFERYGLVLSLRADAEKIHDGDLRVESVGRKKMDCALAGFGFVDEFADFSEQCRIGHSRLSRHVGNAVYLAIPDDILDVDVVAEEIFPVVVDVDHSDEAIAVRSEII